MAGELDPVKDLMKLVESLEMAEPRHPLYFFTRGTGVSDMSAVEFFKCIGDVIVITRNDRMYRRGEFIGLLSAMEDKD